MAKKSSRSGSKKHYPIVRSSEIQIEGSADNKGIIRVDRALSARNHRLYRQSRMYTVKVDLDANATPGTTVDVYALGDSWMLCKAYQLAKETFDTNSSEEIDQLGPSQARWNDFRVDTGLGVTWQKDILFYGHDLVGTGYLYSGGEYTMSEVTDTAGISRTFRWIGSGGNTFNVIDEYDRTGNTDSTPTTALTSAAYQNLEDEIDTPQMEHLSDDGNNPPYLSNVIRNEIWVKVGTLTVPANGQQRLSTGFFTAPAGLIAIDSTTPMDPAGSPFLNLEVKAGDYKGVHAPNMLE